MTENLEAIGFHLFRPEAAGGGRCGFRLLPALGPVVGPSPGVAAGRRARGLDPAAVAVSWRPTVSSPDVDLVVVGAGHAGCEAALAASRGGLSVALVTLDLEGVAWMPCNPSVGGQGKGQLVREIDALGGVIGELADAAQIQARTLNTRKGIAVQSIRVQADRERYRRLMLARLLAAPRLHLLQEEVVELLVTDGRAAPTATLPGEADPGGRRVTGVVTALGRHISSRAVLLATGTYLRGEIFTGECRYPAGRAGARAAVPLGVCLQDLGLPVRRFKTGTPPRLAATSIDCSRLELQTGDTPPPRFSLRTPADASRPMIPCFITRTTAATHRLISENRHRSALVAGLIGGIGPRYCPSIEDKVLRFPEKSEHKVFLEPNDADGLEVYPQGLSTSLAESVQVEMVATIPGLESARITRPGYAVEYDIVDPAHLTGGLESTHLPGLFLAGQINGTSGYEEAAGQGLLAALHVIARCRGLPPPEVHPANSYLGLMVEDITSRGIDEPYRIFTSRSLHRLHLRQSNAEDRLAGEGVRLGVVSAGQGAELTARSRAIAEVIDRQLAAPAPSALWHRVTGGDPPGGDVSARRLLAHPAASSADLAALLPPDIALDPMAHLEVLARLKYAGYLVREAREVERLSQLWRQPVPSHLLDDPPAALCTEARQKIACQRPANLAALAAIPGIRATDVALVARWLRARPGRMDPGQGEPDHPGQAGPDLPPAAGPGSS